MVQGGKHIENYSARKVGFINLISFLLALSVSVITFSASSYFKEALGTDNISIFYAIAYVFMLAILLIMHKIVKKFGKSKTFTATLALFFVSSLLLSFLSLAWLGVAMFIINLIIIRLTVVEKDIMLESFSEDKSSGRTRGLHNTLTNIGFVAGTFSSGFLLDNFGYHGIFRFQAVLVFAAVVLSALFLRGIEVKMKKILPVKEFLKRAYENEQIMNIYLISFLLDYFFCIMVIFIPIYLRDIGMTWSELGIVFGIMVVPYAIMEYPIGWLADKKMGEKNLIIIAILIIAFSTNAIFFVSSTSTVFWSIILLITRIGGSMLEVLRDSYFYKKIDGRDVDLIDFFRTSRPIAYILGSLMSSVLLFFLPVQYLFIMLAYVAFVALIPAFRLKNSSVE